MSWSPSAPAVSLLASLVEERAGLAYGDEDRDLFADKASAHASEAGFESSLDYYYLLRYDDPRGEELSALVDALVVNETYFFRELGQLEVVVDEILSPLVAKGRRPRVWSAACSTGEEPGTLAMVLFSRGIRSAVDIVATDISERALDRARRADHGIRALRRDPPARYESYLVRDGKKARVRADVQGDIRWQALNLCDDAAVTSLGTFDVILCRNVLIYFRDATIEGVVARLASALVPGGTLVVSVSESLLRLSTVLLCEERSGTFLYRKPRW